MAEARHTIALGRDCELRVNGVLITSVEDVYIRETVVGVPATVRNSSVAVSIPIQRSLEIDFAIVSVEEVALLMEARTILVAGSIQPNIVMVSLAGGVFSDTGLYTIHDVTGDEPLNGPVLARFALRQWIGMQAGPVGTIGNAKPPADANAAIAAYGGSWPVSPGSTGVTGVTGPYINE